MPDRIAQAALGWCTLTTLMFWLPTVRGAFDGPSYQWGLFGLGGRGVSGSYWFPLAAVTGALAILAGGWRGRRWAFAVMLAWNLLFLAIVIAVVWSSPGDFRLRGDTLGLDVSLAWVGPLVAGGGSVLSALALWRVHTAAGSTAVGWQARNSRWLAFLAAALPLQFVLLRDGDDGSLSDQIGVLLVIAQWLLIGRVLRSYPLTEDRAG